MVNINSKTISRLREAMNWSRHRLRPFRESRRELIQQYVGNHYGNSGAPDRVPVNFLELGLSTYIQQLSGAPPRAYTATRVPQLREAAADLKITLDRMCAEIRLEDTIARVVQDALFGLGVCKVGIAETPMPTWWGMAGHFFCDWVDFDDWCHDMSAKSWDAIAYCGNRYRVRLSDVRASAAFDDSVTAQLKPTPKAGISESGEYKTATIGPGEGGDPDDFEDEVELWDIWLPRDGIILTLPEDEKSEPLRVLDWNGPQGGPYITLGFAIVPSNTMPLAPAMVWQDLHDLGNVLYRKLARQAERQKSILQVRGGSETDAERIREAKDGDIIRVDGDPATATVYGGPDAQNMAFFLGVKDLFNWVSGNVEVLGGLGSAADTLGQEQMLGENASQRLVAMRRKVVAFTEKIFRAAAHYLYADPLVEMDYEKTVRGVTGGFPRVWNAENRQGQSSLFQVAIEPYSMVYRTPQSQMQAVLAAWQNIIMPAAQLLSPESIVSAVEALLRMYADKNDLPELEELLPYLMPAPVEQRPPGGALEQPGMNPQTTRTYVRKNIPGASRSQKDNAMAQALLGQLAQPNELGPVMR